jgi:hypothetical protein
VNIFLGFQVYLVLARRGYVQWVFALVFGVDLGKKYG